MEVLSPGLLYGGLDLETAKLGKSTCRPLFEEFGDGFKVTIFRKVSNASEKVSNDFKKYSSLFEETEVTETFIRNIEQVFTQCGIGVPFGQTNVMKWLDCSKSKATNIMNAMKTARVIKKVSGLGPGKYEFVEVEKME